MNSATLHVPNASLPLDCRAAAVLNRGCICTSVDHDVLRDGLNVEACTVEGSIHANLLESHSNLFSDTGVYVAEEHHAMHDRSDYRC